MQAMNGLPKKVVCWMTGVFCQQSNVALLGRSYGQEMMQIWFRSLSVDHVCR